MALFVPPPPGYAHVPGCQLCVFLFRSFDANYYQMQYILAMSKARRKASAKDLESELETAAQSDSDDDEYPSLLLAEN